MVQGNDFVQNSVEIENDRSRCGYSVVKILLYYWENTYKTHDNRQIEEIAKMNDFKKILSKKDIIRCGYEFDGDIICYSGEYGQ